VSEVADRLGEVRERIARAARRAGRDPGAVRLVAVSKTFPAARVIEAIAAGIDCFGENRIQEASHKIPELRAACDAPVEWHFVGALQRNKARRAVELFDVIESIDRTSLAHDVAKAARALGRRPRVLLQVNVDAEPQKSGVSPADLPGLLESVAALSELEPVGLMAIPRPERDPERLRPAFVRLRELLEAVNAGREPARRLGELSMGMTADFEVAVEEGATWVRLGTAIFGERTRA
jgi:pyridoxal phosphate enzyme (YggS family)